MKTETRLGRCELGGAMVALVVALIGLLCPGLAASAGPGGAWVFPPIIPPPGAQPGGPNEIERCFCKGHCRARNS